MTDLRTPVPPREDRPPDRPPWDVADMHNSINPISPSGLGRYWFAAAVLGAVALIVPQGWLAWTLGTVALLEFLVGGWKTWRFVKESPPPPPERDWPLTAPLPSRWERRFEAIVLVPFVVSVVLYFIVMGVVVWQFWKVGLTHLR